MNGPSLIVHAVWLLIGAMLGYNAAKQGNVAMTVYWMIAWLGGVVSMVTLNS